MIFTFAWKFYYAGNQWSVFQLFNFTLWIFFVSLSRVSMLIKLLYNDYYNYYIQSYYNTISYRMRFGHTIEDSRKKYPEITDEILDNLQKWANDRGLPNIPKEQLALFTHSCYFDIEATRRCMNVYYSIRATTPELFNNRDSSLENLQHSLRTLYALISRS